MRTLMMGLSTRAALVGSLACVPLDSWLWWFERLSDGGDEPLGLLPLLAALGTVDRAIWLQRPTAGEWWVALGWHGLLAASYHGLPPLLAWATLCLACGWALRGAPGIWGRALLLLSALPSGASLQFYLGYPLRWLTTELAAWGLSRTGIAVESEGTLLVGDGREVAIDAPCAGTHSLWVAAVAVGAVYLGEHWGWRRCLGWGLVALAAVVLANALRAGVLYLFLAGYWPEFFGYHSGVGLLCFGLWFVPWLWLSQSRAEGAAT